MRLYFSTLRGSTRRVLQEELLKHLDVIYQESEYEDTGFNTESQSLRLLHDGSAEWSYSKSSNGCSGACDEYTRRSGNWVAKEDQYVVTWILEDDAPLSPPVVVTITPKPKSN